ncbi:MAG: hypothetical protein MJ202_03635 [Lentisphaeria bacterium]|nr:hypothetical protein [Lentisphaeria bacterium]
MAMNIPLVVGVDEEVVMFLMSRLSRLLQPLNMKLALVNLGVAKFDRSREVSDVHRENMLYILVTFSVLNFSRLTEVIVLLSNILPMSVTSAVSKQERSRCPSRTVFLENMLFIVVAQLVLKTVPPASFLSVIFVREPLK